MDLHDKVALVTGGATRVGRAISLALAQAGADVVVNYNSSATEALRTEADIAALGRQALSFKADVSQADQVQAMVDAAVARFGRLDVLVNSASIWLGTPWPDASEADWDLLNGVAAKGTFLCAWAATPPLKAHGDGAMVNITDLSALVPFPGYIAHSAAKAAVLNLTYAAGGRDGAGGARERHRARRGATAARLHARNDRSRCEDEPAAALGIGGKYRQRGCLSGAG